MRLRRLWERRGEDDVADETTTSVLTAEEFETEMEKRSLNMLGMTLMEFRARARTGELPETPAVDHLRFLLGV